MDYDPYVRIPRLKIPETCKTRIYIVFLHQTQLKSFCTTEIKTPELDE